MARNTKETLEMVMLMEEELSIMLMGIFIWESYNTVNAKDMELMFIKMDLDMKVSGMRICKMVKELKNYKMDQNLKANIKKDRKMDMVNSNGQMDQNIKEIGKIINLKVMESTIGLIKEPIRGNGRKICYMV